MITLLYTCHKCGLKDRPVEVRERLADEIVTVWMEAIAIVGCSEDHKRVAPSCRAEKFDMKIPIDGRPLVGGPVVN